MRISLCTSLLRNLPVKMALAMGIAAAFATPQANAETPAPLRPTDEFFVSFRSTASNEAGSSRIRVRVGILLTPRQGDTPRAGDEVTLSPVVVLAQGASIDYSARPERERLSQVFTGASVNERIARLATRNAEQIPSPRVRLAVQLVRVDGSNRIVERSESVFLEFPDRDARGNDQGLISNEVTVRLRTLEARLNLVVRRRQ